jgi:hypothetical protein
MVIETKFNIGDEVWFKTNLGNIVSDKIKDIEITVSTFDIYYDFYGWFKRKESELYATKEEVLNTF